jgi:16S rRNA C967 or C1407 C5-methylase (RsmB/RsmF family)
LKEKFDRILVDAPCSGNYASDERWFKNRNIKDVNANAYLQREISAIAAECLTEDGEIVLSSCSLEPEED